MQDCGVRLAELFCTAHATALHGACHTRCHADVQGACHTQCHTDVHGDSHRCARSMTHVPFCHVTSALVCSLVPRREADPRILKILDSGLPKQPVLGVPPFVLLMSSRLSEG